MNCPTCDYPMVWSIPLERRWCSVYGDHRRREPSLLMMRADDELHQPERRRLRAAA